ncbi:phage portal protein family protein [Rhodococcus erythropolis]|uniref:phage portal protein family protein n=1 Tax=Rhodococcus erythropolis TaxID=1833 RepID=UPI00406BC5A5
MATPTTASPEIGYVNGQGKDWQLWDESEQVPELQWPDAIEVYRRMARGDARVASVLKAIRLPIQSAGWRIDPNGARREVVEFVALNLALPIEGDGPLPKTRTKGRFSWKQHVQQALLSLQYGHSFFEQVYRIDDNDRTWLHKLAPRPQRTISKISVELDGGLHSIEQSPPSSPLAGFGTTTVKPIPVSALVAYVNDPEAGDWLGSSLLRPAYKHWILKDEFMRVQAGTAKRNGMGIPVGTAASDTDAAEVTKMKDLASGLRGGMASGVGLARGQDLKLLGVSGNLPDMQQAIEYQDKSIALAALAHFLNLDKGGSYSLASVLNDTFDQSVQAVAEALCDTANAHVVEDLVDLNFGPDEPAPLIMFDEIGSRQDATAASMALLRNAGLLDDDDMVKIAVRQSLRIPLKQNDTDDEQSSPTEGDDA